MVNDEEERQWYNENTGSSFGLIMTLMHDGAINYINNN